MRKTIIFRTSRMRIHLLQQAEQPRTVSKHGGGGLQRSSAITGKGVYDNRRRKPAKSDDSEDNSDEK